jgi:hypothetical protein
MTRKFVLNLVLSALLGINLGLLTRWGITFYHAQQQEAYGEGYTRGYTEGADEVLKMVTPILEQCQ